jgi:hypothetical protein
VSAPLTDPRERRTIAAALLLGAAVLAVTWGVLPLARHWMERERAIAAYAARLATLRGLHQAEAALADAVDDSERTLQQSPRRLVAGRTPALAAASLQSLLQEYAAQSRVTVSSLDVAGAPLVEHGVTAIPVTLSAVGDIFSIADLLLLLEHGHALLEVTELEIRPNPALRGELLQARLVLRAPLAGS